MNAEVLLEHFHRFGDAPDAVPRLRRFILELAVHGKLVESDLEDEPVSVFLKKISKDKEQRINEGVLRNALTIKPLIGREDLALLPSTWCWVPFGQLMISRDGERIPVSKEERQTKAKVYDYYGASGVIDKIDGFLFDKPLLLIGEDGANLINRSTPIAFIARGRYWVNNHAHVLDGVSIEFLRWVELFINSIDLKPYVTGTAQPKMNQAKMNSIPIAVPPEAEQHHIVSKVDELMALCDRLEMAQQQREQERTRLTAASWQALVTEGKTPGQSPGITARFALEQLPALTTRPAQVKALRQTILDLAVVGKLTERKKSDTNALKELERIAKKKEEAALRKSKKVAAITSEEWWCELPTSWTWARWDAITDWITYGFTRPMPHEGSGVPIITSKNVNYGKIIFDTADRTTPSAFAELNEKDKPQRGDILLTKDGSIGRSAIVDTDDEFCINQAVAVLWLRSCHFDRRFLQLVIQSPQTQGQLLAKTEGVAIKHISVVDFGRMLLPVPPLAEQGRIVAKVDALMGLCDRLEAALVEGEAVGGRFLEAVLGGGEVKAGVVYPEADVELGLAAEP